MSISVLEGIPFTKMEGCGNDFIVLSDPGVPDHIWRAVAPLWCDRHFGAGSDGIMLLLDASRPESEVKVQMYNPDGSPMGMCGNGIRCLTRYLSLEGIVQQAEYTVRFDVAGRKIVCHAVDSGRRVQVDMGLPSFEPLDIPMNVSEPHIAKPITAAGETFDCTVVSMGNPHCVIPVPSADAVDLQKYGPALESHPIFPKRTNVEFVEVAAPGRLKVRVWERGAGVTLACGTGACASLAACSVLGLSGGDAEVDLPGGTLSIRWSGPGTPLLMTGPAREVFKGAVSSNMMEGIL